MLVILVYHEPIHIVLWLVDSLITNKHKLRSCSRSFSMGKVNKIFKVLLLSFGLVLIFKRNFCLTIKYIIRKLIINQ